jgi:hypothetical protein
MMWPEKIAVEIVAVEIVAAAVDVAAEEEEAVEEIARIAGIAAGVVAVESVAIEIVAVEIVAVEIVAVEIVAVEMVAAGEEAVEVVVVAADEKCRCTLRPMMLVGFFNISEHHSKISSSGIKFFRIFFRSSSSALPQSMRTCHTGS